MARTPKKGLRVSVDDIAAPTDATLAAALPGPRYAAHFRVRQYEMDAQGHVNNAVYLHYLEQAAYEHSAAAGFGLAATVALGGSWIVRRHEIDYLRPASGGDTLQVVTWAVAFKGARALRDYAMYRLDPAPELTPADGFLPPGTMPDGDPVVQARTVWVWFDLASGRPRRIPDALHATFFSIPAGTGAGGAAMPAGSGG